ncbi:PilW family protein [Anaerococcus nagyae]|uniref:PilW family protein n=1 Tax=Anaerococcus nagyae TaxID=1755241 RepID=UPI001AE59270|nr:prepilin-type N-terminal cleavage/methylation domain-containing protein [Anaerococcus nagyae]MBP2069313.1 prepilin-type N-terminal cleavage/methylation domain-containing protein [Anaerococcus nagyae]
MRKKGFTLIELLTALAIGSILIATCYAIFGSNIKVAKYAYQNELDYKESSVGFIYIDNIIRSAYKIELIEDNGETNFKVYVLNRESNQISSYNFLTGVSDGIKYLYAYIDNISNKSKGKSKVRITRCENLYLYFDPSNKTVKILLNKDKTEIRYESLIYVGEKL